MSRARNPMGEFTPNSQGTIAKLNVREQLVAPASFVDGVTITGDGSTGNPLVANVASATVDTDGVTITGDGGTLSPIELLKVFVDPGFMAGTGVAADPITLTNVNTDQDTIEGDGVNVSIALKKVYTQGNVFGSGTQADPLDSLAQCDDDTLEGDGGGANPFKLKKVYVGDGLSGTGTAADPLTASGSGPPAPGINVAIAAFNSSQNVSENAAGTKRSGDWLILTGGGAQPSVATPLRAAFTTQVPAYRFGSKTLALGLDWYNGNNGIFNDDSPGSLGAAALTSYAGEGFPSSSAVQSNTQGRGYTTNYATGFGFSFGALPGDAFNVRTLDVYLAYKKCVVTYFAQLTDGTSFTGTFGAVGDGITAKKATLTWQGGGFASIAFIVTNLTVEVQAGIWLYGARLY